MHTNPSYVQLTAKQQVCLEGGGGENKKYAVSSRPSFQVSLQGIGKSKLWQALASGNITKPILFDSFVM